VIDVVQDAEGVRMALEEIFEEDFVRSRIDRESAGADKQTRERMACQISPRTLSPGYYCFAQHLLHLEGEQKAGITFAAGDLAAFEVFGLLALGSARTAFESRHPACSACGARQQNRFGVQCSNCGIKFRKRK
jgi:NADH pyrophosphatase NudC (nudix superfamily)